MRSTLRLLNRFFFRRAYSICIFATFIFIVYAILLSCKSISGFPTSHFTHTKWPWLGDKPTGEDGFYALTVSDNFSTQHKLVYTYGNYATGIQPLIVIVFSGIAWCVHATHLNSWSYIRVLLFFNSVLYVFFSWQIAYVARTFAPPGKFRLVFLCAFSFAIFSFSLFRLFTYGLETGLYLCCIAELYRRSVHIYKADMASWGDIIAFGVLGGITGLARIDFGVIFAIILIYFYIRKIMGLLRACTCGLIALLVVSPWFVFIHSVSGLWIPSSGHAEGGIISVASLSRIAYMLYAILLQFAPWTFNSGRNMSTLLNWASIFLLAFLIYRACKIRNVNFFRSTFILISIPWIVGFILLDCIYVIFFWSVHFYSRYSSPLIVFAIPMLALLVTSRRNIFRMPIFAMALLAFVFIVSDYFSLHTGHVGSSQYIAAGYVHQFYNKRRVGSFQSGTEGYFNRNVDNLDGKLNAAALHASKLHDLPSYIDSTNIDVLVDWPGYIHSLPSNYLSRAWRPCSHPMPTVDNICLVRKAHGR